MIMARTIRQCMAKYTQTKELIQIGAYQKGSDPLVDQAMMIRPHIDEFTQQGMKEIVPFKQSLDGLKYLSMLLINDAQQKMDAMTGANNPRVAVPPPGQSQQLQAQNGSGGASLRPSRG